MKCFFCAVSPSTGQRLFCLFSALFNSTATTNIPSNFSSSSSVAEFRLESYSKDVGYAAVGLGSSMSSAEVFVAWGNGDGTVTVSRRAASGHTDPSLMTNQDAITVIPSKSNSSSTTGLFIATFQRAIKVRSASDSSSNVGVETDIPLDGSSQPMIWAISPIKPDSSDPTSTIQYHHDSRGSVTVSFLDSASACNPNKDLPSSSPRLVESIYSVKIKAHGILMTIAWCAMAPLAIIIARFLKGALGVWWFRLHLGLMVVGVFGLSGISFGLVYCAIEGDHFDLDKYKLVAPGIGASHVVIGLALLILCSFQVVGGFVIDRLFNPNRTSIPWWDKAHWWMGRLTVVAALVNIPLGIVLYSKTSTVSMSMVWFVSYGLLLGGAVISFIVLQCRMGQTHHHQHMQHVELKDDDDHSPSAAASTAAAAAGAYEAVSA